MALKSKPSFSAPRTHSEANYRKAPIGDRARWMLNAAAILEQEKDAYAKVMTTEMGKTFRSAVDEVAKCAWVCQYYAENAEHFLADEVVETGARRSYTRYQPLGPVLAVMPWNFPFWQVLRFAAPALMAGNVGLLKHASIVPQSALLIEELFRRAGFPQGAFQTLLIGTGTRGRNGVHQSHGGIRSARSVWRREVVRARKRAVSHCNWGV
jgi:succinate-semialdehyde dehydrogenase / glutarate-semialdehyde dehydrogenase